LRDADRRKDEFLAMLAHELRNPLAPIRNAVTIMALDEDDREAQQWSRAVIDRQVQHLSSLVDDLLDVSRITQGKITLTKAPLAVRTFLIAAIETSRPLIDARKHRLDVFQPEEALRVEGDPTRLAQVIANLLNNAAKYTPDGGHIRLSVERDGDEAVIRVKDDGEGISSEMLPRVFDLFSQASQSIDRSEGGLGIGLTLVKRLVEMHGGTVEARSGGPGHGSEFIVRLPLLRSEAPAPPRPRGAAAGPGRTRRILVVDDSRDSADSLARLLRRLGHEVEVAYEGPSAYEAGVALTPDIVLLDIGLPGMDGYEVARRLRAEPSLDGVCLVALTGYGSEVDRQRSTEAGFDAHLVKPVEFDALRRVLEATQVGSSSGRD
jgi:CheY-like chemotaxis protein